MLEVLSGLCASFSITIATLLLSLSLLVPDHLLDLSSPEDLLLTLEFEHFFVLSLLLLVHGDLVFDFVEVLLSTLADGLLLLVSHLLVVLCLHVLFLSPFLSQLLLFLFMSVIAFSHFDNVGSPLARLDDLLSSLALFILKKLDPVGQQLSVFFSSLPCEL